MDDLDVQQMTEHPAQGAYLVKIGTMFGKFSVRCEQHKTDSRWEQLALWMPQAIARMQRHNARFHHG